MGAGTTASKRQFAVTLSAGKETWRMDSLAGGSTQQPRGKYWNAGAASPDLIPGRKVYDNITCSRRFTPAQGVIFVQQMNRLMAAGVFTATRQPLDENGTAVGRPQVWTGCQLIRVTAPDYDEQSDTDPAITQLEFTVQSMR